MMRVGLRRISTGSTNDNYVLADQYHLKVVASKDVMDNIDAVFSFDMLMRGQVSGYLGSRYPRILSNKRVRHLILRKYFLGREYLYSASDLTALLHFMFALGQLGNCKKNVDAMPSITSISKFVSASREDYLRFCFEAREMDIHIPYSFRHYLLGADIERDLHVVSQGQLFFSHGDLHGLNVLYLEDDISTVIDWDGVSVNEYPWDFCKTLWLVSRKGRGGFEIDHGLISVYSGEVQKMFGSDVVVQLAMIGAINFIPRLDHMNELKADGDQKFNWYCQWVSEFWRCFEVNIAKIKNSREIGVS